MCELICCHVKHVLTGSQAVYKSGRQRNSRRSDSAPAVTTVRALASSQDPAPVDSDSTGQSQQHESLPITAGRPLELLWPRAPCQRTRPPLSSLPQNRRSLPTTDRRVPVASRLLSSGAEQVSLALRHPKKILLAFSKPLLNRMRPRRQLPWLLRSLLRGDVQARPKSVSHFTPRKVSLPHTPLRELGHWPLVGNLGLAQDQPFHNLCSAVSPQHKHTSRGARICFSHLV